MKTLLVLPLVFMVANAAVESGTDAFCAICVDAVQAAINAGVDDASTLEKFLDNDCDSHFSGFLDNLCKSAANMVAGDALKYLQQHLSAKQVCQSVHLCQSSLGERNTNEVRVEERFQQEGGSFECSLCQTAVKALESELESDAVETKIKDYFLKGCNVIPNSNDMQICIGVINQYFPQIWSKVVSILNPKDLCIKMGACSSSAVLNVISDDLCSFCKTVFTWFQKQILTQATEQDIMANIDKVCENIPNQEYAKKCKSILDKYGEMVFSKIVQILGPSDICQELKACPAPSFFRRTRFQ